MLRRRLGKAALLAFTLLGLELMLQVATHVSRDVAYLLAPPWERDVPVVPDPLRGYVGNPLKRDHDRDGFRNPAVPEAAEVVVFGDSQCYGTGVTREEAWPGVLSRVTGLGVYNMALPGHGPGNALLEVDQALRLRPRTLLAAVYFGNDLYDGFALARTNPEIASLVPDELMERAEALETESPLSFGFADLFGDASESEAQDEEIGPVRRLLSGHSALYALLRALRTRLAAPPEGGVLSRDFAGAVAALDAKRRAWFSPFDGGDGWRTILTARYRARVMDLADPRLAAGLEVAVGSLLRVDHAARAHAARLIVVLVPTKEFVFSPRVPDPEDQVGLPLLLERETALRRTLRTRLEKAGIPVLDLAPVLRAGPDSGYFEDADGHPDPEGQERIARAVAARLEEPSPAP